MSKKVLYFEGAGCVPRGDVENCRIRTAFINDKGKSIYLEITSKAVPKGFPDSWAYGFIDYCHYITNSKPNYDFEEHRLPIECKGRFEYSKSGILKLVNEELHCSFEKMIVTDIFDGYHVHANGGRYNMMDNFIYCSEHAEKARNAFHEIDMQVRKQLGEKYSQISLNAVESNSLSVRCYASDMSMKMHGMNPRNRIITVSL